MILRGLQANSMLQILMFVIANASFDVYIIALKVFIAVEFTTVNRV